MFNIIFDPFNAILLIKIIYIFLNITEIMNAVFISIYIYMGVSATTSTFMSQQ